MKSSKPRWIFAASIVAALLLAIAPADAKKKFRLPWEPPLEPATPAPAPKPSPAPAPAVTPAPQPQPPVMVTGQLALSGARGMAPHTVHVHAMSIGAFADFRVRIDWDFGDPGSKYNVLRGFNSAHVYDQCGTYKITAKAIRPDSGVVLATAQATVTIDPDTRRIVKASNQSQAQAAIADNTHVILTGRIAGPLTVNHRNVWISGGTIVGAKGWILTGSGDISDTLIDGVSFEGGGQLDANGKFLVNGVSMIGQRWTTRNCSFKQINQANDGSRRPAGVLLQDCASPIAAGLSANFLWGEGSDYVAVGDVIADSTKEHCLRFGNTGTDRIAIALCNLTNLGAKQTIVLQNGTWAYAWANHCTSGELNVSTIVGLNGTVTSGVAERGPDAKFDFSAFEDNVIANTKINLAPNTHHSSWRNNTISYAGSPIIPFAIQGLDQLPKFPQRRVEDVEIIRNTRIGGGGKGWITAADKIVGLTFLGNTDH